MKTTTLTVKIKPSKTFERWFKEQSSKAVKLYNYCLNLQMTKVSCGEKLLTAFDLAKEFRLFELGSDYKDRIYERVADSTLKWLKSESFRYIIYWSHKEESEEYFSKKNLSSSYKYINNVNNSIFIFQEYKQHIKNLSRKQKIFGMPKKRKKCSLAFSIRKTRQDTIGIKKNKMELKIPKYKDLVRGQYNMLPTSHDYQYKLVTLKQDHCKTIWFKVTLEEKINRIETPSKNCVVGIDMGLKTTRTAVAIHCDTKEIIEIYQPIRTRHYEKSYQALVWASNKDRRHLPFIHRKIARRRLDNIGKDITKIINMGDEFKFGKPSSAFLLSGRLAKSASDAANSMFLTRFAKVAELARKKAGEVDESYTSVTCRKCLNRKSMPLSERIYFCNICEHEEDRDVNSGYQIAFRKWKETFGLSNKKSMKKNGQLTGREMKFEIISQRDFQALSPCKPPDLSGGAVCAV